jgi:hypothetical protein
MGNKNGQTPPPCPLVCGESEDGCAFAAPELDTVTANLLLVESEPGFTERAADKHENLLSFDYSAQINLDKFT